MKQLSVIAMVAISVSVSGCASIIQGSSQSIAITTPPTDGAQCALSSKEGNWTVVSPGSATVDKSKDDIRVRCTKPGYQDGVATIPSNFDGWTVGNLVAGGVIGVGVDAATGAINEYPHSFQVPMLPLYGSAKPETQGVPLVQALQQPSAPMAQVAPMTPAAPAVYAPAPAPSLPPAAAPQGAPDMSDMHPYQPSDPQTDN